MTEDSCIVNTDQADIKNDMCYKSGAFEKLLSSIAQI